ncbi:hypothetical protein [Mesorhizobium sp. CAU 1732]|uniref:hypothetical protein n=1 Tax=Mesorhizobium sp. CAU 1732 TaxID=3140358 RepID=UPI0032602AFE
MSRPVRCVPARPGAAIPMPDRDNRLMPADGVSVDLSTPYYRRLRDDGDIVPVQHKSASQAAARGRNRSKEA